MYYAFPIFSNLIICIGSSPVRIIGLTFPPYCFLSRHVQSYSFLARLIYSRLAEHTLIYHILPIPSYLFSSRCNPANILFFTFLRSYLYFAITILLPIYGLAPLRLIVTLHLLRARHFSSHPNLLIPILTFFPF